MAVLRAFCNFQEVRKSQPPFSFLEYPSGYILIIAYSFRIKNSINFILVSFFTTNVQFECSFLVNLPINNKIDIYPVGVITLPKYFSLANFSFLKKPILGYAIIDVFILYLL